MKAIKLTLSSVLMIVVTILSINAINTSNVKADPLPGYHEEYYSCPIRGEIMRCEFLGMGCDVSKQNFCDEIEINYSNKIIPCTLGAGLHFLD